MSIKTEYEEAFDNLIAAVEHTKRQVGKPTEPAARLKVEKAKQALEEAADRFDT